MTVFDIGLKMPEQKKNFIVDEDERLLYWDRQVRAYVAKYYDPKHQLRLIARNVFEFAGHSFENKPGSHGAHNQEFKRINRILRHYFGASYVSFLQGHKQHNTYKIPPGFYIRRAEPLALTLYIEWLNGTIEI